MAVDVTDKVQYFSLLIDGEFHIEYIQYESPLLCSECGEDGEAHEDEWQERNYMRLCDDCADKYDHTCATCGSVSKDDLVQDGESKDGDPWMVCPGCVGG